MCGASSWCVHVAVAVLVAFACLEVCLAAAQRDPRHARTGTSGSSTYCGSRLSDALKFLCNGQYNSYFKTNKTPPPEEYWAPPVQLPFRDRLRAASLLESRTQRTRVTRGVFDECCSKSCTIDELMAYCELRD
ncbi:LIRP-like isoform X2 [Thrips palmi]|nr:LIRP-like isoform X2 [Thrips palmi]XP_034249587.1 LIRP-like isoform X2 [Thrips palmi]